MDLDQVKQLIAKGQAHFKKGRWAEASKDLTKAMTALDRMKLDIDGKKVLSEVLQLRAFAETRRGQYRTAVQAAVRALEISHSIEDLEGEAEALRRLGHIHWLKGDLPKASDFFDEALVKARECADNVLIGTIRIEQGNVSASLLQYEEAKDLFLEAAKILKVEKALSELSRAYNNLGFMLLLQKKYKEAVIALRTAMDIADQSGDARLKNMAALNAAECFVMLGNPEVAAEMIGPVTEAMLEFDDKAGIASAYRIHGMICTATKQWPKAEGYFRKAYALVKVSGNPEMEGAICREYGRMFIAKGDKERARVKLSDALEIYKKIGVKDKAADVQQILKLTQD
jgi:tetratricopeptide (TPR) repeat protein